MLMVPATLLALAREPAHGYPLLASVFGQRAADVAPGPRSGALYRLLRELEALGWVTSHWATAQAGPARRVYALTPEGRDALAAWVTHLRALREEIDRLLDAAGSVLPPSHADT